MKEALGMIEVKGLVVATEVADIMVKTANVRLSELKITKGIGWVMAVVLGDVGAVQAAIEAAKITALSKNAFVSAKVIPRPAEGIIETVLTNKTHKQTSKEKVAPQTTSKPPKKIETQETIQPPISQKNTKNNKIVETTAIVEATETQKNQTAIKADQRSNSNITDTKPLQNKTSKAKENRKTEKNTVGGK